MTKVLVTGGAGFVGQHLVKALIERQFDVRVFDLLGIKGVDMIVGSVNDLNALRTAMIGVDIVYHLAGDAQLWARDRDRFDRINHQGTRSAVRAALEAGVRKFVHCSSLTTLVGIQSPIGESNADESTVLTASKMLGPYPLSKLRAEQAVLDAVSLGLEAAIAIPTEPLGPGDVNLTPPSRLIVDLLNGRIPVSIECALNFVSVRSLALGLIAVAESGRGGERYILGGENISLSYLLTELERVTGRRMPSANLPYAIAFAAGLIDSGLIARLSGRPPKAPLTGVRLAGRRVAFSSAKAKRELNWRSEPWQKALEEALVWFRERSLVPG